MDQNKTLVTEIILLGFSNNQTINIALFLLFFFLYLMAFIGNVLIMYIIIINHQLHTPMYYFLCILSFVDLCTSTTIVPRLLADLFSTQRSISVGACAIQFYVVLLMGGTECLLLAIMAYDHYIAICRPLHYPVLMRWSVCYRLTALLWIASFFMFVFPTLTSPVPLCNPNKVNTMCELLAIFSLSCSHLYTDDLILFAICFVGMVLPLVFIVGTYFCIISSVLAIHSVQRPKAFSTCTSHITVVLLFYVTAMIMNFGATSPYLKSQGKYISVFYYIVCPMLNPVIYSLNSREVKEKLRQNVVIIFFQFAIRYYMMLTKLQTISFIALIDYY